MPVLMHNSRIVSSEIAINLGISLEAYEYIVNGKSALDWINDWPDDPHYHCGLRETSCAGERRNSLDCASFTLKG